MASDYSPPRLVKPTPGGSPGDGTLDGKLTLNDGTNRVVISPTSGVSGYPNGWQFSSGSNFVNIDFLNVTNNLVLYGDVATFRGISTQGVGVSPIYGANSRVTVAATTSPGTTLTSFTPGATGSFKVHVTIKNKDTVAVTAYVLVAYTDPDVGAQSILVINGVSVGPSGVASASFVLDSTATAITVSAYGSVADELVCTADIEQFA